MPVVSGALRTIPEDLVKRLKKIDEELKPPRRQRYLKQLEYW